MTHNNSTCSSCGKPLSHQACIACEGSGFTRELALIKRECTVCHGSGRVLRCEDEFKHIVDDFKASRPVGIHDSDQPPQHRRTREPHEHSPLDTIPRYSVLPENPWNLNVLNLPVKPGSPHSTNIPGQRSTRRASHKK